MIKIPDKKLNFCICIFLAALTFVVYLQVLGNDFINYDDTDYVTENPHAQAGLTLNNVKWAFTTFHCANWHPLTWLSHMADYELFGLKPWGHHLTSLLIHIVNVLILFAVLKAMTGATWRSAFVAAIFAIHPLNVESVAWIAERKNVLSTMFWLLTIAGYWKYSKGKNAGWYLFTLLLFAMGLASKPMVVTLPFVLLLLDYWPIERLKSLKNWKTIRTLVVEKIPFFVFSAVSCMVTFQGQKSAGAMLKTEVFPWVIRFENAALSYGKYIAKSFCPIDLAIFYPLENVLIWKVIVSITVLSAISVFVIKFTDKNKYPLVGWLWYLGTLVPVIGLIQVGSQAIADRYAYVPLVGIFIMIGWTGAELSKNFRRQRITLGLMSAIIIVALSAATMRQLRCWHDSITLFEHAKEVTKNNCVAYCNLGEAYGKAGRYQESMEASKQAIKIKPHYAQAYNNLGYVYGKLGRYQESMEASNISISIKPDYADAHYNLGYVYGQLGRYQESIDAYEQAIKLKPDYADAYNNLGNAYARIGRYQESIEAAKRAIKIKPNYPAAYYNLGHVYKQLGRYEEAVEAYKQTIKLKPDYADSYYNLGNAYGRLEQYPQAVDAYKKAIRIRPGYTEAHFNLGFVYMRMGNKVAAMKEYEILRGLNTGMAESLLADINK